MEWTELVKTLEPCDNDGVVNGKEGVKRYKVKIGEQEYSESASEDERAVIHGTNRQEEPTQRGRQDRLLVRTGGHASDWGCMLRTACRLSVQVASIIAGAEHFVASSSMLG